jgi:hypothetical protein
VLATHGRSFWILDDLTPLYQYTEQVAAAPVHLYMPRLTYHSVPPLGTSRVAGPGKNYMLALGYAAAFSETTTATGETVRTMLSTRIDQQLARWQQLVATDVATFNTPLRNADVPAVVL